MAGSVHSEVFRMRVAGPLLARARYDAKRRGMTLSEFMRDALRARIGDA